MQLRWPQMPRAKTAGEVVPMRQEMMAEEAAQALREGLPEIWTRVAMGSLSETPPLATLPLEGVQRA